MRCQAVNRAIQHLVAVMDIHRRQLAFADNAAFDVFQPRRALQLVQDFLAIGREHLRPIMMRAKIGRVHQHIKRFPAFRRDRRICARWRGQICGGIGRRFALAIDGIEFFFRIAGEDEIMMRQMFVTAIKPEIEHHTGTGRFILLGVPLGSIALHQFRIGANRIHVRNQRIAGNAFAIGGDATHRAAHNLNIRHLGIGAQISPKRGREVRKPFSRGARTAHRIPNTFGCLHIANAAQYRRRQIRAGPDILREVIQHLRQLLIRHMAADDFRHCLAHAQRHDITQHIGLEIITKVQRIADAFYWLPEEEFLRNLVQMAGDALEAFITRAIWPARCEGIHGPRHVLHVFDQINLLATIKKATPLRIKPDQRHFLLLIAPGFGEDAAQHARYGQDGGAHIETESPAPIG